MTDDMQRLDRQSVARVGTGWVRHSQAKQARELRKDMEQDSESEYAGGKRIKEELCTIFSR